MSWQRVAIAALARLSLRRPLRRWSPERIRWYTETLGRLRWPIPSGYSIERRPTGGVDGLAIRPPAADGGSTLLYLHGGGYVFGAIERTHLDIAWGLAGALGWPVVAPDYRRAPESPFPAAVDDALAVARALVEDGRRLVVAGDSAGGGLALALLVAMGRAGLPMPAGAVALSPWTDLARTGRSVVSNARTDDVLTPPTLERMAALYLAGQDPRRPLASPLHAELGGLPPTLLLASDREILLDDTRRMARRLAEAGVDVEVVIGRGQLHAWPLFWPYLPEGRRALDAIAAFVGRRAGRKSSGGRTPPSGILGPPRDPSSQVR